MKISIIFIMLFVVVLLITGCVEIEEPENTHIATTVKLSDLNGHFEIADYKTYGVWYLRIDKVQLQNHLPQNAPYYLELQNRTYTLERNKLNEDQLFVLLPEDMEKESITDALITIENTNARNPGSGQKRTLLYLILKKDTAENGTDLFRLSLSDYLQLKTDKTSFIYNDSILIRPFYVISNEGSAYTLQRYLDARQSGTTKDVDGAFRFLNNLSNPDSYMFFGNPNKVVLKTGGQIEKTAPDNRQRLRMLGSAGDLSSGNFYNIEEDTSNNRYIVMINLNNTTSTISERSFISLYLRGASETFFINTSNPDIFQTTVSFDLANSEQLIKNARCSGFMFKLMDDSDRIKGHYSTLQGAVNASTDENKVLVGTRSVIYPEQQTLLHDKNLGIMPENDKNFILDYTNCATRSLLITGTSSLTLNNANIINCHTDADGGAILSTGLSNPVLLITESIFSSNTSANGGAIKNEKGTMIITESTLTANIATENGGAVYNADSCTITNVRFLSNQATGTSSEGNALYNGGTLTFYDNIVDGNTCQETNEAVKISLSGTVYNSTQGKWKRFNIPSADVSFVEDTSVAENLYRNQGSSEGNHITFETSKTPEGTLTLIPVQGEEGYPVSLKMDYVIAHETHNGSVTFNVPTGFEITGDASVIFNSTSYPASIYSPQQQIISISTLTLDEGSTVTLLLKEQVIPAAFSTARVISKDYDFIATSDADGSESAWSVSDGATAIFTSTGNSRNTDFHLENDGEEMYITLETNPATSIKVITGKTPAYITSRLHSADGEQQIYTIFNDAGVVGENTALTADATLTVTPPKGVLFEKDFAIHVNSNLFVKLEEVGGNISWENSIQDSIDNGSDGATITLWEGTYTESVDLGNNNYHIVSTNPSSNTVRDNTIITGVSGAAITINGGQDNNTLITGLYIKGNTTGSGIKIGNANPVISENRIALNQSQKGAGIFIDAAGPSGQRNAAITLIQNNLIENNSADYGGGIYVETGRNPMIVENEIKTNTATTNGGGIYVAEGGTVQNTNGVKWQAHQLPGTTNDAKEIEGSDISNTYTLNSMGGSTTADNSQLYYTRTDTSHLTDWVSHDKLNQIIMKGIFSAGDIMRVFDSSSALTEIASTTYTSGGNMAINRDVTTSSTYYVSLQDTLTTVYAQSTKKLAPVINTPATPPGLLSPANGAINVQRPVTMTWKTGIGEETFNLYFGTNPSALTLMGNYPRTTLQFTHNSLAANTTYYWKVEGVDRHGATNSSPVYSFTTFIFEGGDGSFGNPYQVKNAGQLNKVRNYLSSYFIQTGNINLSAYNWDPIDHFTGQYNGQNYTLSGLRINRSGDDIGLFGNTSGAKLKNIHLTGVNIYQSGYSLKHCGALVGDAVKTTIENCHSSGSVGSRGDDVGGLIGRFESSQSVYWISNSHSDCSVTGRSDGGGLVGRMQTYVSVKKSYATGDVTTDSGAGGLIGIFSDAEKVEDCYARGDVKATYYNPGVQSGYEWTNGMVGGLIGRNNSGTEIKNCYSTGKITYDYPSISKGGLIGRNLSPVTDCYWDTQTSGMTTSNGGTGLTTGEMKNSSNYTNWNFSSTWAISSSTNGGYPYLRENSP